MSSNRDVAQSVPDLKLGPDASTSASANLMESNISQGRFFDDMKSRRTSSTSMLNVPPITFTSFPKLPLELRRKVWREAVTPRIIYILRDYSVGRLKWKVRTSSTIALLSVNTESRLEALKMYEKPFHTRAIQGQEADCRGPCYINFTHDIIYISFIFLDHCFDMIFKDRTLAEGQFMNIALDHWSLESVKFDLHYMIEDKIYRSYNELNNSTWDRYKLRKIRELVLVVDPVPNWKHSAKILLDGKTSADTPVKKATEKAFAEFQVHFPHAILPQLSTCYRVDDLR